MAESHTYISSLSFSRKTNNALNQFWAGFIIYTTSYTLIISGSISHKIVYLQLLGMVIFLMSTIHLITFKIEDKYLRNIFLLYCGWQVYIVLRGFTFSTENLFNTLTNSSSGIFLYLSPLILLFPKNLIYLKKVIIVILILSVFYIVFNIVFIKALLAADVENGNTVLEYFSKLLGIPTGFILITIIYHSDKRKLWAVIGKMWVLFIIVLTLLLAVIKARRGLMFMSLNLFLFSYIIYYHANKRNLFSKFFPLFIIFFVFIYAISISGKQNLGAFDLISERLNEDSRSNVEEYFYLDMNKKDWIAGKGIEGYYYCPTGATEDGYRNIIETDYLQIILKGGFISLGLLLLIAIPAIFMGFFYSKNILSKAAAAWILLFLIDSYPANVSTFSLNYLLVWISIGICYSKEIRNLQEDTVKEYFQYKLF